MDLRRFAWLAAIAIVGVAPPAGASEEISGFPGTLRSQAPAGRSFGLSLSYASHFAAHLSASVSYINEGHVPSHHRDGIAAQLWVRTRPAFGGLSLSAGLGPYRYFDTTPASNAAGYVDAHGWGRVLSVAGTWRSAHSPWLVELRLNRILVKDGMDTSMLLAGLGYRLERDDSAEDPVGERVPRNEAALLGGQSIVNSFESERAPAWSLEYRRELSPLVRASIAWLNEGATPVVRRHGATAQLWLEPSFYGDRLTLGIGAGPYLASDERRGEGGVLASMLLSVTASVSFTRDWAGRVMLSRVASRYDRDSDVLMAGVGYRF